MVREFIPYEQALELKELGFDEPCFAFYGIDGDYILGIDEVRFDTIRNYDFNSRTSEESNSCSAPLYQQAFRWLRERYSILLYKNYGKVPHFTIIQNLMFENPSITYEEAELACLKKLIEIIKNK